jgi:hypothetical protein
VHFKTEQTARQRSIMSLLCRLELQAYVYVSRGEDNDARAACLTALVDDLVAAEARRLVVESREGRDHLDRHVLRTALGKAGRSDQLGYEHFRPSDDPLLWAPDAVAWCYGAGGDWLRRVKPLLRVVRDLDAER